MKRILLTLGCLGCATLLAPGQEPAPSFVLHTSTGPLPPAPLVKFADPWRLRLGGTTPRLVDGPDLIALRRSLVPPPPFPEKNLVVLTNGDRLPFAGPKSVQLLDESLSVTPAGGLGSPNGTQLALAQAYVSVLWFTAPAGGEEAILSWMRLHHAKRAGDVVLFRNGDRLEGTVKAINAKGCRLHADGADQIVPLDRLAAVAFNSELQALPRAKGMVGQATLASGARLSMTSLNLNADRTKVTAALVTGPQVVFALTQLINLEMRHGQAVYLADLPVKKYEAIPYLSLTWPLAKDQAVGGGPLRLGAGWYDHGLGMRGQCRVSYRLDGAYRRFEAWAGLDAAAGPRSRLKFSVLLDGKEQTLKGPSERTTKDAPLEIQLNVTGAAELTLQTDFGAFGDVAALATWANARLIKK